MLGRKDSGRGAGGEVKENRKKVIRRWEQMAHADRRVVDQRTPGGYVGRGLLALSRC